MSKESKTLTFSVDGAFITQLARERYHNNAQLAYAINLLKGCLESDKITQEQQIMYACMILNEKAELKGTYPNDDYRLVIHDENETTSLLNELTTALKFLQNKITKSQEDFTNLQQKYDFVMTQLSEDERREIDNEYYNEFDEHIFDEQDTPDQNEQYADTLLKSFLERQKNQINDEEDYGWLEPNGTFHPVPWGCHQEWAENYVEEHLANEYKHKHKTNTCFIITSYGDFLIKRGWVLLHNPAQGIADITSDPTKNLTKRQQTFLYDYYTKRNQRQRANAIFKQ